MKIIGLCGGSGSGKTGIAELFSKYGFKFVDTDAVYRNLTSEKTECLLALADEFGPEIINNNGTLDRKSLSAIVFAEGNSEKREKLNKISHYYILARTREILNEFKSQNIKAVLIDAPLLFESGFYKECDVIIAVIADIEKRAERICFRDGISMENAISRINSQLDDAFLCENSDFIIENNGDFSSLEARVAEIADEILSN